MDDLDLLDLLEEHADLVISLKGGNADPLDELDMLERVAEIIDLLSGKDQPVISLTGKEFGDFDETPEGLVALREKAIEYLEKLKEKNEKMFCSAVNTDVYMDKTGIKKTKSFSSNRIKLKTLFAIKELLANSTLVKANKESYDAEEKKRGIIYSTIKAPIIIEGIEYGVRIVLRKLPDGTYHYDLQIRDNVAVIFDSIKYEQKNSDKGGSAKKSDVLYRMDKSYQYLFGDVNSYDKVSKQKGLDKVGLVKSLGQNQALDNNDKEFNSINQAIFDKATTNTSDMVLNLFIFDENGNEITDDLLGEQPQSTALQSILTDLQSGTLTPADLDLVEIDRLIADKTPDKEAILEQIMDIISDNYAEIA